MIKITSKKEGYRRCGMGFNKGTNVFQRESFSDEAIAALKADPNLTVEFVDAEQKPAKQLNVGETIKLIEATDNLDDLTALAEGDTRKGVLDAIAKRRTDLLPA